MKRAAATLALSILMLAIAGPASALNPGSDLYVPAAARVSGISNGVAVNWATDLNIFNPGTNAVSVNVTWLPRDTDNSAATPVTFTVQPQQTLVLPDVISTTFGLSGDAGGAFHITATGNVIANARIYNTITNDPDVNSSRWGSTFGQGLEGIPASAAVTAGGHTDIIGLADTGTTGDAGTFRSNVFAVNTSTATTTLKLTLLDASGAQVGTPKTYTLKPMAAFYEKVSDIAGGQFPYATLRVEVTTGSAIVIASKNDNGFSDGTTLESSWPLQTGGASTCGGDGLYTGYIQYSEAGGMTIEVKNDVITYMQGSLIVFSPDDGGTNCGNVFPWSTDNTDFTPVSFDASGNFSTQFTVTGYNGGLQLTFNMDGSRSGDTITGSVTVTAAGGTTGSCSGTLNTVQFFAGHTVLNFTN
ncbi:MAG: hypothetical protein GXP48_09350 [Acidobacteria bacterium]|nr:hypothetical protein [Acidobacteriota bacterium]